MAQFPVARLGDTSDHGGFIISVTTVNSKANGILVARVSDLHFCPRRKHGITPIVNGSGNFKCEGKITAVVNSVCGCGAKIIVGSPNTFAPFEAPSDGGFKVGIGKTGNNL